MNCFFVTDLHGNVPAAQSLLRLIRDERPRFVFLGGDLLAGGALLGAASGGSLIENVLAPGLGELRDIMGSAYPHVFVILGNDDPKSEEPILRHFEQAGFWQYVNQRHVACGGLDVFGYSYVPPTPFLNKDWERYDVSRFVDVGCVPPDEGYHSIPFSLQEAQNRAISEDLADLADGYDLGRAVFLFHAPPYQSGLDRAALDGKIIDHVPLDVYVGSIAIKRFILERQPLVTLHGHVHESYQLSGVWKINLGKTVCLSAAGNTKALTLVRFSTGKPHAAKRQEIG